MQIRAITRHKIVLLFTILFPIIFIGIFGIAFSAGIDQTNSSIKLAVVNLDSGIPEGNIFNSKGEEVTNKDYFTQEFFGVLSNVTYDDSDTEIFELNYFTEIDEARIGVEKRIEKGLLIIPENFTKAVLAARRSVLEGNTPFNFTDFPATNFTTMITLEGDNSLTVFSISANVISSVLNQFLYSVQTSESQIQQTNTSLDIQGNISSDGLTIFDFLVPGLIIFAIIGNLSTVASALVIDIKTGQLERLRLTNMSGKDYLAAIILSQLAYSAIQVPIMFGMAIIFGFSFDVRLLYGILFALIISLSITGIAIIVAAFVKQESAANALSGIIGTPMAFLAGAFFDLPNVPIIPEGTILGDNSFGLFDLIPARPAITALRVLLLTDRGFFDSCL